MRGKITALMATVAAAVGAAGVTRWARGRKGGAEPASEPPQTESQAPPVGPDPASDPPATGAAPAASPGTAAADDLTAIKGLGKVKAAKLLAAGVTSYSQMASWTDDDIAEMGLVCNTSPGQIKREDWVGQAKALAEA